MTSKTFSYEGEDIQILGLPESKAISIYMTDSDEDEAQIDLPMADAPALMQAIAECLPPLPDIVRDGSYEAYMAVVVEYLDKAVRALEYETTKAKEQAELKAEALELVNAWRDSADCTPFTSWDMLDGTSVGDHWLAVARRAREIGAGK